MNTLYGQHPIMMMHLAEQIGLSEDSTFIIDSILSGMKAYAHYAYEADQNTFKPLWADGTDLSNEQIPRTGYFGEKGRNFAFYKPQGATVLAYVRAVQFSDDGVLWNVVRHMLMDEGLGDIGAKRNGEPQLNFETNNADPELLMSLIELYEITTISDFLYMAERLGDNIIRKRFHNGYFMPAQNYVHAKFDTHEPLALLHLEAARKGMLEKMPAYLTGSGETDGEPAPGGRPSDEWLYNERYSTDNDLHLE